MIRRSVVLVLSVVLSCCALSAQQSASPANVKRGASLPSRPVADYRDKIPDIFSEFHRNDTPGAAVIVLKHGEAVFESGYGVANLKNHAEVTPTTNFRLASVTKQFTAAAILLLVHDGKLRLDETLTEVLPGFPAYGRGITIRNLLNHTSGLVDYEDLWEKQFSGHPSEQIPQIHDAGVLELMEQQSGTQFQPGTKWQYSNSGYAVLATIVERVSGQRFEDFLRQHIFAPLGMTQTVAYVEGRNEVPERAFGYSRDKQIGEWKLTDQSSTSAVLGDGGIYSSIEDLALWVRALDGHRLLPANDMAEAYMPVKLPPDAKVTPPEDTTTAPVGYGFGWFLGDYKGHRRIWHDGETVGFRTTIQRFPDSDLAVIVLTNRSDADAEVLSLRVADLYLMGTAR
jgi:CubicO group peptidase (beta-lactamase class C family)